MIRTQRVPSAVKQLRLKSVVLLSLRLAHTFWSEGTVSNVCTSLKIFALSQSARLRMGMFANVARRADQARLETRSRALNKPIHAAPVGGLRLKLERKTTEDGGRQRRGLLGHVGV